MATEAGLGELVGAVFRNGDSYVVLNPTGHLLELNVTGSGSIGLPVQIGATVSRSTKPKLNQKPGFIYAVRCDDRIKLGRTRNLEDRIRYYTRIVPDAEVIATLSVPNCIAAEADLCAEFSLEAGKREWMPYSQPVEKRVVNYFLYMASTQTAHAGVL